MLGWPFQAPISVASAGQCACSATPRQSGFHAVGVLRCARVSVLGAEGVGVELGSHAHDGRRPHFEIVRVTLHRGGLDGAGGGTGAVSDPCEI